MIKKTYQFSQNGPERLDFKRRLFSHLDEHTPEHVLIASSSSGLPSSEFVTECKRNPARVLIGHPFNPPHLVPLVEIVPHPETGDEHVTTACQFYRSLGKDPVIVRRETPGFIANRLQAAVCAEAYSLIARGIVSAEDLGKFYLSLSESTLLTFLATRQNCDIRLRPSVGLHWSYYDQHAWWWW